MQQRQEATGPTNILATTTSEATAQMSTTLALANLQSVAVSLRAVREMLEDSTENQAMDAGPESLGFFVRTSVEGVLVDNIEPAMRTLAKAATATREDLNREWHEQEDHQEASLEPQ
jgi:hypothetical protein